MLGPDGVAALTESLDKLSATVDGLRLLGIGLAVTNCAVFAIVLSLWQKLNPVERETSVVLQRSLGDGGPVALVELFDSAKAAMAYVAAKVGEDVAWTEGEAGWAAHIGESVWTIEEWPVRGMPPKSVNA